jgi:small-conductance mechanosensitive channel
MTGGRQSKGKSNDGWFDPFCRESLGLFLTIGLLLTASAGQAANNSIATGAASAAATRSTVAAPAASAAAGAAVAGKQESASAAAPQATTAAGSTRQQSAKAAASAVVSAATKVHLQEVELIRFVGAAIDWYRLSLEESLADSPAEALLALRRRATAEEILRLVFDYAEAKATLIKADQAPTTSELSPRAVELVQRQVAAQRGIQAAKSHIESLKKDLATARRKDRAAIIQQLAGAQNELELAQARADFLTTLSQFESGSQQGPKDRLVDQIDELEKSILPATEGADQLTLGAKTSTPATANQAEKVIDSNGVIGLIQAWLDFQRQETNVENRAGATQKLRNTAEKLIEDYRSQVLTIEGRAGAIAATTDFGTSASALKQRQQEFQDLLGQRKLLLSAILPLSKANLLLEEFEGFFVHWRAGIEQREVVTLKALLWRLGILGSALLAIFLIAHVWRRLTYHYIEDLRRRRQVLKLRNVLIGTLVILLVLINFMSELGSLATVIGFGAAGVAIALQDVILSAAGYFRISGRFGIKVGDWVELMGVRGEVLDIGLTKLSLLELAGEHGERGPTGRVAVLPNSAVFKEKFVNRGYGTAFTWRDVSLTIGPECDYRLAEKTMLEVVEDVFAKYRDQARRDSRDMERRLNVRVDAPRPHGRINVTSSGTQISVNYPVDVHNQASVVDEISRRLLDAFKREPSLRLVPPSVPNIQFAPKPDEPEENPATEIRRQA